MVIVDTDYLTKWLLKWGITELSESQKQLHSQKCERPTDNYLGQCKQKNPKTKMQFCQSP